MEHPIFDWNLSKTLAGNNDEAAREILTFLMKTLPADLDEIRKQFSHNQIHDLSKSIHRLHGALCYCGVPRLKQATKELEKALKEESEHVSVLFSRFEYEANELLHFLNMNHK